MSYQTIPDLVLPDNVNPYYEKWKPGRPSKAAKEKRAKSDEWFKAYREAHPEEFPMITFLTSEVAQTPGIFFRGTGRRNVQIKWQPRNV